MEWKWKFQLVVQKIGSKIYRYVQYGPVLQSFKNGKYTTNLKFETLVIDFMISPPLEIDALKNALEEVISQL